MWRQKRKQLRAEAQVDPRITVEVPKLRKFYRPGILRSIAIIGGCGHVGLPLGLAFARRDQVVTLLDIDAKKTEKAESLLGFRATTMLSEILDEIIPWVAEQIDVGKI